ncbi:TerB family tellurite resistance protein [Algibacter sp.]|uniref:TerB family tellurite resistance protein n=1 Tax=Algibacter sp. TaxID=1872428 RepID=UPI003C717ED0
MASNNFISSKDHSKKFAHFSALVFIAQIDGEICADEVLLLKGFAKKLGIDNNEYHMIMDNPSQFPVQKTSDLNKRLRRLFEMFQIIFANNIIDDNERKMVYQYAIELGFSPNKANSVIDKSIELFTGKFSFHDYSDIVSK